MAFHSHLHVCTSLKSMSMALLLFIHKSKEKEMFLVKIQVLKIVVIFYLFKAVFCFPTFSSSSSSANRKRDVSSGVQKTIDELYSKLMDREFKNLAVKAPKLLSVDIDRENINLYVDDDEEDSSKSNNGKNKISSICENSTSSFMPPFPAFITPFMTLLSSQYTEWRNRNPKQISCLVSQLKSIDSHPCPHENSSCVVISLPNNHVFFGCMNDKTGELVAPKNWDVLNRANDSDKFLIDFRVPSPFKIDRQCKADSSGKPICQRVNIFHNDDIIVEDAACCCKGDYCADILFDQTGFNPAPFIHIETDESERINPSPTNSNLKVPKPKKLSVQDPSGAVGEAGFDWSFSPLETGVIICVVIMIVIIVIAVGLWFVYEREKAADKAKNDSIERETSVFTIDDYPFALEKNGKRLY